jgi:hypothetical protein
MNRRGKDILPHAQLPPKKRKQLNFFLFFFMESASDLVHFCHFGARGVGRHGTLIWIRIL